MKFKAYTGITWSLLELSSVLEDENSRVSFEKVKKHFGLHPFHLTNIHAALNEILSSNLNAYDPELKGFVLAYKNPKLLNSLGEIFYDTCFIHIDVEADFYIFRPEVGCTLTGIVNKKGLSHIGLLVHKAFNISIPKPDGEEDWPGDKVEIGQEVRVHLTHLDYTSRLPFIRGAVNEDDYLQGCKLPIPQDPPQNRKLSICLSDESEDAPSSQETKRNVSRPFFTSDSDESAEEEELTLTKVKEAKKKKQSTNEEPCSSNEIKVQQKKQKKSKKVKNEIRDSEPIQEEFNDMSLNSANEIGETLDETLTDQPTKKSKSKSGKKSMEPPQTDAIPKLKKERVRLNSSDSVMDDGTYMKIRKEKSLSIQRQSDVSDAEVSTSDSKANIKTSSAIASKKTKLSKAQPEDVGVKEELVATMNEEGQKKKRKKKKLKEQNEETPETEPDINVSSIVEEEGSAKKCSKKAKSSETGINIKQEELVAQNHTNNVKAERRGSQDSTIEKKQKTSAPVTILPDAIIKIKKERSVSLSGSETEKSPRKTSSEKRSKSKKQSTDDNDETILDKSTECPGKRSPKKMKITESETVPVKHEISVINNAQSENSDATQSNLQSSTKKKKNKKQKHIEENEMNNVLQNIKTEFTNSTGFNLSSEIPIVVKQEKITSDYETDRNEPSTKSNVSKNENQDESVPNTEETGKKKRKKKKHDKDEDTEILEGSFEVMIKTEPGTTSDIDSKAKKSSKRKSEEKNKSHDDTKEANNLDCGNIKIKVEKDS